MKTEYLFPKRVLLCSDGVENADGLLKRKTLQIGLGNEECTVFRGGSFVALDFGREVQGGIRILSHIMNDSARMRLRFGESLAEACSELGEKGACNDHSPRDFEVCVPQLADVAFGETGFRFVRVDFIGDGEWRIKNIVARSQYKDVNFRGGFECDDSRINDIYAASRRTLHLCLQNGYVWDGIKRDRLVWIGDLHPESLGLYCTLGNDDNIKNSLELAVEQSPLPEWMNSIPMYSMWWVVNLHDYYVHTGDIAFVKRHAEYFSALMRKIDGCISCDGKFDFGYDFFDWHTHGTSDEKTGVAALCLYTAKKAVSLAECLGLPCDGAKSIVSKLRSYRFDVESAKQVKAMCVLAGADRRGAAEFFTRGGDAGMSVFMSYYIARAAAECGKGKQALGMLRSFYGTMLDKGATTFWEAFDSEWARNSCNLDELPKPGQTDIHGDNGEFCYKGYRNSLCHGWSCGPIAFLTFVVLGVRILDVGCKKIAVSPDLCGLKHVKGVYPTPYGDVFIEHARRPDGSVESKIKAPPEVEISDGGGYGLLG